MMTTQEQIRANEKRIAEIEAELAKRAAAKSDEPAGFELVKVDMATGRISYPSPAGFVLDSERVYRTAGLFAAHAGSAEMAVRLAIWQQIAAYRGSASVRAMVEAA